jgi:hypothetical protein
MEHWSVVVQLVKKFPVVMETEAVTQFSEEPTVGLSEPVKYNLQLYI